MRKLTILLLVALLAVTFSMLLVAPAMAVDAPGAPQVRVPTGNGYSSGDWGTGAKWSPVNENVDGSTINDSDYITLITNSGGWQLFTFPAFNVPEGAWNISLRVYYRARDGKEVLLTGNSITAAIQIEDGTLITRYRGTYNNPDLSWRTFSDTWSLNPATGAPWTVQEINGISGARLTQFGVRSDDGWPDIDVSAVWAVVSYSIPRINFLQTPPITTSEGTTWGVAVNVRLSTASTETVTVDYYVTYGSTGVPATPGVDYTIDYRGNYDPSGTLVFAPGDTYEYIGIYPIDDSIPEFNETLSVYLWNPTNAILGTCTETTVQFIDNDFVPPTDISLSSSSVAENQPAGTTVGTFSTTDANPGDTFTYILVAGSGDMDNAFFTISGNSLRTAAGFDYETKNSYGIRIRSTDSTGRSYEEPFTISITDVNEPPGLSLANKITSLPETINTSVRVKVADIVVSDDALGINTLSLSGADAALFEIYGGDLYIKAGTALDYHTNPALDVTVSVDDPAVGATPDDSESMSITVTEVLYTLTVYASGGSVDPAGGSYLAGSTVTLHAYPAAGYEFAGWSGDASGTSTTTSVVMNSDKTVYAGFYPATYQIYTVFLPSEASATCSISGPTSAVYGQGVSLTANPGPLWEFSNWSGYFGDSSQTICFTMPDHDVYQYANFEPATFNLMVNQAGMGYVDPPGGSYRAGTTVTLTADPYTGWRFAGWTGDASGTGITTTVYMDGNKTVQANFEPIRYGVLVNVQPPEAGSTFSFDAPPYAYYGDYVAVSASAGSAWIFDRWESNYPGISGTSASLSFTMPAQEIHLTAYFRPNTYNLTVATNPAPIGSTTGSGAYEADATVSISVLPAYSTASGTRYLFTGWSGPGVANPASPSTTMTMPAGDTTVTANYVLQYYLTANNGGHGTAGGSGWYNAGYNAQATIDPLVVAGTPGTQYVFAGWSGAASGSSSTSDPILMDGPKTATAIWTTQYQVTFAQSGLDSSVSGLVVGGTIASPTQPVALLDYFESEPLWADAGTTIDYYYNGLVGSSSPGKRFWLIDVSTPASGFTVSGPMTLTGTYKTQYQVTFAQTGLDGSTTGIAAQAYIVSLDQRVTLSGNFPGTWYWADSGTVVYYNYSGKVASSTAGKQFVLIAAPSPASGFTVSGPVTLMGVYKTQYLVIFTQSGLDSSAAGTVVSGSIGSPSQTVTLAGNFGSTSYWVDEGTTVTYNYAGLVLSDAGKRFVLTAGPSPTSRFTVSGPQILTGTYKTQYLVTFAQSGLGDDATGTTLRVDIQSPPQFLELTGSFVSQSCWVDAGKGVKYTYISPVSGGAATKYVWAVTSGFGQTAVNNMFTVEAPGTLTGHYWKWTVGVSPASQQYSGLVTFTATLTPASYPGATAPASVDFYVNAQYMGTGTASTAYGVTTWTLSDVPPLESAMEDMRAGVKTVTARFNGLDSINNPTTALTVTKENAIITLDSANAVAVRVGSDGGNNSAFTWSALIHQALDGYAGNLGNIQPEDIALTFSAVGSGGGWTGTASTFDPATGIATFNVPADVLGVETYAGVVTLDNEWFVAAPAEDVLVVYDPSLGFTTGGGWFTWPAGTQNPELEGARVNFGYTMKYTINKKNVQVKGSLLLIAHLDDGGIIRLKSNALYGLAIVSNTYPGIASFSGKCVYTRLDADGNVLAESGNQEFKVYVQDMDEPGNETDMFWFTTKLTIDGELPFSLDGDGDRKVDANEYVYLGGGNLVVPHTLSDRRN